MRPEPLPAAAGGPAPAVAPEPAVLAEQAHAARNALKLGASLLATWSVALGARVVLPRYLGPELFGRLNFADALTTASFVLLGLGIDTYARKEVPLRPALASEFFGGVLVLRTLLAALLAGLLALALGSGPREVERVVLLYGGMQYALAQSNTLAALLHAHGSVDGLSAANVGAKLLWCAGMGLALALGAGVVGLAAAALASEAVRAGVLWALARRHLGLRLRLSPAAAWGAVAASLPFYVNTVAHTVSGRLDVSMLTLLTHDETEVGWYGAAANLASLTLLATPLLGWVLMPLMARALARSGEEFDRVMRRSVGLLVSAALPLALALALGAETWVRLIFGPDYAPAAGPLRILAPVFVITYLATLASTGLLMVDRGWAVTATSLVGLALVPLLNLLLIHPLWARLGPGGAGVGSALALLAAESVAAGLLMALLGRRALDWPTGSLLLRGLGVCLVTTGAHLALRGLAEPARLAADALVYLACATLTRALPIGEVLRLARTAVRP